MAQIEKDGVVMFVDSFEETPAERQERALKWMFKVREALEEYIPNDARAFAPIPTKRR